MSQKITIQGAREHNLKNINLELPQHKFIVFTGISGSGKSTLAMDTIFAEGQRRYLESLSSYARQFLGQMEKPEVDHIDGLSPAIAIDQKRSTHNPRSTVGTVTEIYDYLRLLLAKIGQPHCPKCARKISSLTIDQMVDKILEEAEDQKIKIYSPIVRSRKGQYLKLLSDLYQRGYLEAKINNKIYKLEKVAQKINLERYKMHDIEILIDTLEVNEKNFSRLFESIEAAIKLSQGLVLITFDKNKKEILMNQHLSCAYCDLSFPNLEPRLFSFNSPYGACEECHGLGTKKEITPQAVMPDINKTIEEGGLLPWTYKPNNYYGALLRAAMEHYQIPPNRRLKDLSEAQRNIILYGEEALQRLDIRYVSNGQTRYFHFYFSGIINHLKKRYQKTESEAVRKEIEKYMEINPCPTCFGARLKKESLLVKIGEKNLAEISSLSITKTQKFFAKLEISAREKLIADRVLKEIKNRLKFLNNVGLGYLTLDRAAMTLAGGETQRIRLASQVGSGLTGVLYVLDEPSIGLHAHDNQRLLETLTELRDLGNTLIVIEHDEETMRQADWLVDIGPKAGQEGGEIMASGPVKEVLKNKKSLTAKYLNGDLTIPLPEKRRKIKNKFLTVKNATEHNLKNINVHIPLGVFNCVTGVSGSGKSTLVNDIIYKTLARQFHHSIDKPGRHGQIEGTEHLDKVIIIDQSPIGRTPRSNPATYTGLFMPIRELFTSTRAARTRGYRPGRFSFNVNGGRCEACSGEGFNKIEMQFLPDVYVPCEVCHSKRYNRETLEVKYKEKNIAQVLEMTVNEALEFFRDLPQIADKLKTLKKVGLDYIHLGQAATTLSGGEAQRVKLATELAKRATGRTLYILDEPTTGLHFEDINKLLIVLNQLVEQGNTVLIIEHQLDIIKSADWITDLGPEGGEAGGKVVVSGTPEEVAKYYKESYTGKFLRDVLKK